jgi:flagellar basal-body rod modification protein FlgD
MMMSTTGIWNHAMAQSAAPSLRPMDSSSPSDGSGGDDASSSSATISANDFLTLLVTEMQNQDPTSDTDPNEYIDQLVDVNSLEQLININQTLSTAFGGSTSTSDPTGGITGVNSANPMAARPAAAPAHGALSTPPSSAGNTLSSILGHLGNPVAQSPSSPHAPGNLSIPGMNPAAQRVASSLSGHRSH